MIKLVESEMQKQVLKLYQNIHEQTYEYNVIKIINNTDLYCYNYNQ